MAKCNIGTKRTYTFLLNLKELYCLVKILCVAVLPIGSNITSAGTSLFKFELCAATAQPTSFLSVLDLEA